jgi:hypothetical protein
MTPKDAFPAYSRCFKVFSRMIAHLPDSTWLSQDFPEKLTLALRTMAYGRRQVTRRMRRGPWQLRN